MSDFARPQDSNEPQSADPFGNESDPAGWTSDMPVVAAADPQPLPSSRPWMAVGAAALVILVIGGGALLARAFLATSVAAADVMPPDTELFFSVDFLQLIEGDALKLNDTIISMIDSTEGIEGRGLRDVDGLIEEIDAAMSEALGIDFTDDIRPWVGRTVSVSVSGFRSLVGGDVPDVLLAVETRDGAAADEFLTNFAEGLQQATGASVTRTTRNGSLVFTASDEVEFDPPLVFARVGSMVVFGTRGAVDGAMSAASGPSLAGNAVFASVMDALPSNRLMSFYLNGAAFSEALRAEAVATETFGELGYEAVGAAVSINDYGVRVDAVTLGTDPGAGIALEPGHLADDLPVDTLVMFGGWSVASLWDAAATALGGADTEDLLAEAEAEVGVDLGHFLGLLDGPSALALVKSGDGTMAGELDYPIGLLGLFGTTSPADVQRDVEKIVEYAVRGGFGGLTRTTFGSGTYWIVEADGSELAVIGVDDDYLVAASSASLATSVGSSPSLSDNTQLEAAAVALGVEPSSVALFVDTQALVEVFEAPADLATSLRPLGPMAAAYEVEGEKTHGVFVWLIDYVSE